jgi:serine/threonine protein kinase
MPISGPLNNVMSLDHNDLFDAALRRMWKDLDTTGRLAPFSEYARAVPEPQRADLQREHDAMQSRCLDGQPVASPAGDSDEGALPSSSVPPTANKGSHPRRVLAGRYEILYELDRGGMGIVYLGRDLKLDRQVVLKTPRTDPDQREELRKRLECEAKTLSKLEANGICPIHDLVEEGETLYVVLSFIPGRTLAYHLASALKAAYDGSGNVFVTLDSLSAVSAASSVGGGGDSAPWNRSRKQLNALLELMGRIARSVHAAHKADVVHRDLKPANIMVTPAGEPVILDFGFAVDQSMHNRLSSERAREGTPAYMAPEQIGGTWGQIDQRTDVYALGVILYEVLTLKRPYSAPNYSALSSMITAGNPRRLRRVNRAIPPDLEAVCLKAMDADRTQRYATALEFAEELERVCKHEPTHARPLTMIGRGIRRARRHPVAAAALAISIIAVALALGIWTSKRAVQEPLRAFQRYSKALEEKHALDERDLQVLAGLYSDPADVESFRRNPGDPDVYMQMQRRVIEAAAMRGPPDGGEERLLEPRETVTDPRPTFRFEVPDVGTDTWSLILRVWTDDDPRVYSQVVQHSGPARKLEVVPPPNVLQTGRSYVWSVSRTAEEDPDHPLFAPDTAAFRIEESSTRDAIVAGMKTTGVASFDALVRANALLVRGFVKEALSELDGVAPSASRHEWRLALSLRAEAALRLGDQATFEKTRREALESGGNR